jgi:hypothetical protein
MRHLSLVLIALSAAACGSEPPASSVEETSTALRADCDDPNPALFSKEARPYGKSIERWSELLWSYIYAQPIDHSPFLDTTGADCAVGQKGPVWFLPAVPGATLGTSVTRTCTIPRHRAILLQLASAMNDYPCPDPAFKPAAGQSLFDFLSAPVNPEISAVTGFEVSIDGTKIEKPLSPGAHTIVVNGQDMHGTKVTLREELTIR